MKIKNYTLIKISMKSVIVITFLWMFMVAGVHAASFDCIKAKNNVEHLICDNQEISKLDDELSASYVSGLQNESQAEAIKRDQRQWIKVRNNCLSADCLVLSYQNRISELAVMPAQSKETLLGVPQEEYVLVMSKDNELCNHMLQIFNKNLKEYGWRGDENHENHEVFKRVPWQNARFSSVNNGRIEYTDVEGALFDFNNDGVKDFVVRFKSSLSNVRADLMFIFDAEVVRRADKLVSSELWNAENRIDIAGSVYYLSSPLAGKAEALWILSPFVYNEISYLFMRPVFEEKSTMSGYAVISKYSSGKFVNRDMSGKMEDICYYQRNREKHTH